MESISIIKIKLRGILDAIEQYTSETNITAVRNALDKAMDDNDFSIILFGLKELDKWYEKNISAICSNEFVFHKEEYRENMNTIKEIISDFESNYDIYKKEFEKQISPTSSNVFSVEKLLHLLERFHNVVIQLRNRHNDRETLDVSDEYDVQDLLHALLEIYCEDIRDEEWTPSYAGTCSRQDFLLKQEKIVIETKKTRKGLGNRELADELIIDIDRYKTHPDCKYLICFVYDPENRIRNPRGFEYDLSKHTDGIEVIVIIRP